MRKLILPFLMVLVLAGCQLSDKNLVVVHTEMGDMKIKLYDETPGHRDNFLKLTQEGYFDSLMFHRVIKEFMIQGGDPDSKTAKPGDMLGMGGPGYTLPAEIDYPHYFHKKGVIAAAREGDQVNPEKKSSGSQFYIVQGKKYTDEELDQIEAKMNDMTKQQVFYAMLPEYQDTLRAVQQSGDKNAMMALQQTIMARVEKEAADKPKYEIPADLREVYKTEGGVPFLDSNYTVFGEVVEGLDVIDKIADVEIDKNNRPVTDVRMKIELAK
ncbi:peptidylprolyl isomerase [Marinilabiliaceae bacterium JC017]|nr:peptidylprolyl isomerase [Marinilabiliaceae bacterium JC017]